MVTRPASSTRSLSQKYTTGPEAKTEALVRAVVAGPSEQEKISGITSALPEGTTLGRIEMPKPGSLEIYLDLPAGYIGTSNYSPRLVETIGQQLQSTLLGQEILDLIVFAKDPASGEYRQMRSFFPKKTFKKEDNALNDGTPKDLSATKSPTAPASYGPVTGALSGKAVVLNQGHGWLDDSVPAPGPGWRVQRTKLNESLEDYSTAEFMDAFVVPMLLNCGARVQPVRECDMQTNMVIVDNADAAYSETGTWSTSTADGFKNKTTASWTGTDVNPFGNASATRWASGVTGTATATATYLPNVPAAGYYNVYISYSSGSNRSTQAHWQVYHTGGVTDFYVNQQRDGSTWYLLGNFYFDAGSNPTKGKVVALNDSGSGSILSVDAVRLGGGMGDVARRTHGVSGKARFLEEAMNYLNFTGAVAAMNGDDTVGRDDEQLGWGDRPTYANWEQSRDNEGKDTIYVGFHTNAFNGGCSGSSETPGTARGTTAYRDADANATPESISLANACQAAVISNIRTFYDSSWGDRHAVGSTNYGECTQSNLGTVPGFFFEALFADNPSDCNPWKDPKLRYIFARGIVQGIISFYGGTVFPPEPPTALRIKNTGNGQVRLDWVAGPVRDATHPYGSAATAYRVYRSTNGYGFDNGTDVTTNNYSVTLPVGQLCFFRVAAVNSSGVSFPTETLAVRAVAETQAKALIVNGSHRFDRNLARLVPSSGGCANNLVRKIDPRNFQSFNYSIQHGKALANAEVGFDSCSSECVDAGTVDLSPYRMVDWIGGQEAESVTEPMNVDDTSLKPASRAALQSYLEAGGCLFISNSELAYDLKSDATKLAFLNNYMKAGFSLDDANTYQAQGSGGIFTGVGSFSFDDGTGDTYEVRFPDVLSTNGGSTPCMSYVGGTGGAAAVQYAGAFGTSSRRARLVYMGFGFETIRSETTRNAIMSNIVGFFMDTAAADWTMY